MTPSQAQERGIKVRALEWERASPAHAERAIDLFGGGWSRWVIDGDEYFMPPNGTGRLGSADADYEARILAALE